MRKFCFLFLLFGVIVLGQNYTFTGNANNAWSNPGNWEDGNIPLINGNTSGTITIPDGKIAIIATTDILNWSSGTINGPGEIVNNGTFNLTFGSSLNLRGEIQFNNSGVFNVGDGTTSPTYSFNVYDSGTKITNNAGGTINLFKKNISTTTSHDVELINNGTINKSGSENTSIATPLTNNALIEVEGGMLTLSGGSNFNSGTYNISEDAILNIERTNYFEGTLSGNAAGEFRLAGGSSGNHHIGEGKTVVNQIGGTGVTFYSGDVRGPGNFINGTIFFVRFGSSTNFREGLNFTNNGIFNVGDDTTTPTYSFNVYDTGTRITNNATGTINLFRKNISTTSSQNVELINNGTINKSGSQNVSIATPLTNNALIEVEGGMLTLNGGSNFNSGTYNISESAVLNIERTNYFEGTLSGNAIGEFRLAGGSSGNHFIEEDKTVVNQIGGTGITIHSGDLKGPGNFINETIFFVRFGSSTNFREGLNFTNNGVFNLGDDTTSPTYSFNVYDAGTKITNNAAGTINLFRKNISTTSSQNVELINNGTINKSGSQNVSIATPLTNNALIEVEDGMLTLDGGSNFNSGTYNISESAVLNIERTNYFEGTLSGNAAGEFRLAGGSSGNHFIEEDKTVVNQIGGTGITIHSGDLKGPGIFVNETIFTVSFGSSTNFREGLNFTNNGIFNVGDDTTTPTYSFNVYDAGTKITNNAAGTINLFRKNISTTSSQNVEIINNGTINKSGSSNVSVDVKTSNEAGAVISSKEGSLYLSRNFHNKNGGLIEGGTIKFNNDTNLTNEGTTNPGPGIKKMTIETFYSMDGGVLEFNLNGLTAESEYDVMEFTGTNSVNLTGDINPILAFAPDIGDSFTVFNMTSTNGSHIINASLPPSVLSSFEGMIYKFGVGVTSKQIILTVTDSYPEPCDVPEDLTVLSYDYEQAAFSWSAAEETSPIGYEYYIGTSSSVPSSATGSTDSDTLEVTVDELEPNTTYYIRVRTNCDWNNFSDWSAAVSFTTDPLPCDNPVLTVLATDGDGNELECVLSAGYYYAKVSLADDNGTAVYNVSDGSATHSMSGGDTQIFGPYAAGTGKSFTATDVNNGDCSAGAAVSSPAICNLPPVADAGADQSITLPTDFVTLDGSASYDPDGNIATYSWTLESGSGTIVSPGSAQTQVTGMTEGISVFKLTVTDNDGASDSDTVTVIVNPEPTPECDISMYANIEFDGECINADEEYTVSLTISESAATKHAAGLFGVEESEDGEVVVDTYTITDGTIDYISDAVLFVSYSLTFDAGENTVIWAYRNGQEDCTTNSVQINSPDICNLPPTADAGADQTITLPTDFVTLDGSASYDPDGSIASYLWTLESGSGTIVSPGAVQTQVTGMTEGTSVFKLTITDNEGATDSDWVTITVEAEPAQNLPPIADAGADQTIILPTDFVTLDGSASYDPDGSITTYLWTLESGSGTIASSGSAQTQVTGMTEGTSVFKLTVTDNEGATDSDWVTITVEAEPAQNLSPIADAGANQAIILPTDFTTLDGSASYDPDGSIVSYLWTLESGSGTIVSPGSVQTQVIGLNVGTSIFRLTVTDNDGATDFDEVTVTVDKAPIPDCDISLAAGVDFEDDCIDSDGQYRVWVVLSGTAGENNSFSIYNGNTLLEGNAQMGPNYEFYFDAGTNPVLQAVGNEDNSCTSAIVNLQSPAVCQDGPDLEAPCMWAVRVWSVTNGEGTSWYLMDGNGVKVAQGNNLPATYDQYVPNIEASGPVTFHLDATGDGYRSLNYNLFRKGEKIEAGTLRNKTKTFDNLYCEELPEPELENPCDWTIRVWTLDNGAGTSWSVIGPDGQVLAGESDRPATFNDIRTFSASGPLTFKLNAVGDGYRSVNYNVINHPRGKIAAGVIRNQNFVLPDLTCEAPQDAEKQWQDTGLTSFDFSYYPNPVKDVLHINSTKTPIEIRAYNLFGQQMLHVEKISGPSTEIDMTTLPEGIYIFRAVMEDGRIETFKVLKQ